MFPGKDAHNLGDTNMTNYNTYAVIGNSFPGFNQVGYISDEPILDIRFTSLKEATDYAKANGFCFANDPQCWHVIGYDENNPTVDSTRTN